MDDLAGARKKGVWAKKGEKKSDIIPGSSSAPSAGEKHPRQSRRRKRQVPELGPLVPGLARQRALSLRKQTDSWNPAVRLQQVDAVCPCPPKSGDKIL